MYPHEKQNEILQYCFHYSVIDLTIGDGKNRIGGILIRTVIEIETDTIISGPLKSANYILIAAHNKGLNAQNQNQCLSLKSFEYGDKMSTVEKALRIGLDEDKILAEYTKSKGDESCYYNRQCRFSLKIYTQERKYISDTLKNSNRLASILKNE